MKSAKSCLASHAVSVAYEKFSIWEGILKMLRYIKTNTYLYVQSYLGLAYVGNVLQFWSKTM